MLETHRLMLRKWTPADAERLFEYAKDPEVGPPAGWPPHRSIEESRSVIDTVFQGAECYAICEKGSGLPMGAVELMLYGHTDLAQSPRECELGYWIGKPFWGKGYVPEAAGALLKRAFGELGMETVWCAHYDGNQKSKRVQEKLGFQYHHTISDSPVPLLNEVRVCHVRCMTRARWEEIESAPH